MYLYTLIIDFVFFFLYSVDDFLTTEALFDDQEDNLVSNIEQKVGYGKTKTGLPRKSWRKNFYFESDLFPEKSMNDKVCGYTCMQIDEFFDKIKMKLIKPKETETHARNKLIMWLDRMHNKLGWNQIKREYRISTTSAIKFANHVLNAIVQSFAGTNIVCFPNQQEREIIVDILKKKKAAMPWIVFSFDGKHAGCDGMKFFERMSYKYHFHPCFNLLFIIERGFNTICAFNLDAAATKHDTKMLYESSFYYHLYEILNGWICVADKGYVNEQLIAAGLKRNDKRKKFFSKTFWKNFNTARNDSEHVFAYFFVNKFGLLANWKGKAHDTWCDWALNVTCAIIIYNYFKKQGR